MDGLDLMLLGAVKSQYSAGATDIGHVSDYYFYETLDHYDVMRLIVPVSMHWQSITFILKEVSDVEKRARLVMVPVYHV